MSSSSSSVSTDSTSRSTTWAGSLRPSQTKAVRSTSWRATTWSSAAA
ncbi:hypothetical protein EJP617_C150 (plasmid) [Erwinia sp. Ejp617]|nr:hypothetical protein EJP617_C150 [Erwinia sp. Ejp617]